MTTHMNIDVAEPRVEIGSTWYAARVQRTLLNTEAKLPLLAGGALREPHSACAPTGPECPRKHCLATIVSGDWDQAALRFWNGPCGISGGAKLSALARSQRLYQSASSGISSPETRNPSGR